MDGRKNFKIEQKAFSKYVLELLLEQFAPIEARFGFLSSGGTSTVDLVCVSIYLFVLS